MSPKTDKQKEKFLRLEEKVDFGFSEERRKQQIGDFLKKVEADLNRVCTESTMRSRMWRR